LLKKYKVLIHNFKVAAYHPQSYPAERINKLINVSLRSYVVDDHRSQKIASAINSSKHISGKFAPNFVNFGRDLMDDFKKQ
jgi:hypothetical protein